MDLDDLNPARRFEWERVVRRVRMPVTTRCVAFLLASYGNPDGTRIRPGRERLARVADVNPKTISRSITVLRSMGLIALVSAGSGSSHHQVAAEYMLTLPPNVLDELPMLDPSETDVEQGTRMSLAAPVDNRGAGDTGVPGSEGSMGHLTPEHGTSGGEQGTPESGAGDIAMSTYQTRPEPVTPDSDHASVPQLSTSRPATGPADETESPVAEKCPDCDATGYLGYDDDMRPIPCPKCRPHLARVIPMPERNAG